MSNPQRYRPFRLAATAAYVAVGGAFCLVLLVGGYRGAMERMGSYPPPADRASVDASAIRACLEDMNALYAELNGRLDDTLARSTPARRSNVTWEEWSPQWRSRVLAAGARCRLEEGDVPAAAPVREVYQRLLALHRHYTTLAVQFAKEIGPHADKLHQTMERANIRVREGEPEESRKP